MARTKKYNEQEVTEKAMNLFWKNGYANTSMQMLEKEMGINKFSIYSSFGNKDGLFLKSLDCYKSRLFVLINKLVNSSEGKPAIKKYFYDFVEFTRDRNYGKGCLVTNTANEIGMDSEEKIPQTLKGFTEEIKQVFADKLKLEGKYDAQKIEKQADYLLISMFGLSSATRIFTEDQLEHYIEHIFRNI